MKNKIGITLLALYFIQHIFLIKWASLEELQSIELYKKWSGVVLLFMILYQWHLSLIRMRKDSSPTKKELFINIHKWLGILLPIFFYLHSTQIGYGILFILSLSFFVNIGIGFLNTGKLLELYPKFFNLWLVIHIVLSVGILIFTGIQIWLVLQYN